MNYRAYSSSLACSVGLKNECRAKFTLAMLSAADSVMLELFL